MGIKGLTQLIKQFSPDAIETVNLHTISGKTVAIDASLFMYKMLINMRGQNGDYLKNDKGKIVSHITGIFYKTANYLAVNITPIYVFDGKPPQNKDDVLKDRHAKVSNAKESMKNEDLTESQMNKLEKQTVRLTKEYVDDIKMLLTLMGVSYVQADGEAEAYASEMCRKGKVDYVVTEDMDTLAFGCPKMIRTCLDKSIKRSDVISVIDLDTILVNFDMSYIEFIDMCILCGCDYCGNLPRIGNKTAFNHIKKYKNIEGVLPKVKELPEDYVNKYKESRRLFTMYHDSLDVEKLDYHESEQKLDELFNYLTQTCCMSEKRVQNSIKKITNGYK
jgi:flap endonuclease-1